MILKVATNESFQKLRQIYTLKHLDWFTVFYQYQSSVMRQAKWRKPTKTIDPSKRLRSFVVRLFLSLSHPLERSHPFGWGCCSLFFSLSDSFLFWVDLLKYPYTRTFHNDYQCQVILRASSFLLLFKPQFDAPAMACSHSKVVSFC